MEQSMHGRKTNTSTRKSLFRINKELRKTQLLTSFRVSFIWIHSGNGILSRAHPNIHELLDTIVWYPSIFERAKVIIMLSLTIATK